MADKKGRVQAVIQKDLSEIIIYGLKSDLTKFASINEVKMTNDYSYCKVYVSHIDPSKTEELVSYLNNRAKRIRSMLSKKLDIYKTPELIFVADLLFEQGQEMDRIIDKAVNKKPVTLADVYPDLKKKEKANMKKPSAKAKKPVAKKATAPKAKETPKATKKTASKKAK